MNKYSEKIASLSNIAKHVTQQCGTEPPFQNEFWDNHSQGLYVDVISGEPLFYSYDKFDSATGWPSFYRGVDENITENTDNSHGMARTEVRSKHANSHLGHVFNDVPTHLGARYCINSASLRFIAYADLQESGYGEYTKMFEEK